MSAGLAHGSAESGSTATVRVSRSPITQAHSPPRLGLETCAAAGVMDGLRRPLVRAFEPGLDPDTPVKVPPLPRVKRKPKPPRFLCVQCGETADHPDQLCLPVPMS